jgi:hypothetical protein
MGRWLPQQRAATTVARDGQPYCVRVLVKLLRLT